MPRFRVLLPASVAVLVSASLASAQTPPDAGGEPPAQAQDTARRGAMSGGGMGEMDPAMRERMHAMHMRQMQGMGGAGAQPGAMQARAYDHDYDGHRRSGAWAWGAMIAMTVLWLLVTALVSWIVYRLASGRWSHRGGESGGRAIEVLRDRYARGEIDRATYDRMLEDLERGA